MSRRLLLIRHCDEESGLPAWPCLAQLHAWQRREGRRPLTARGRRRAARLARLLQPFAPQLLLTSPLTRAEQTAEILGHRLGLRPQPLDGLREIVFGRVGRIAAWPLRSRRRRLARIPLPWRVWAPLLRVLWLLGGTRTTVPPASARRRAALLAQELAGREEECIALVAHGVVLLHLLDALCGRGPTRLPRPRHLLRTGEYRLLEWRNANWCVVHRGRPPAGPLLDRVDP